MIANCGMLEFPYKGNPMSWVGFRGSGKVQCYLDRAIGNEEWHHMFSHTNVEYLKLWGSDHRPVLAKIQPREVRVQRSFNSTRGGWERMAWRTLSKKAGESRLEETRASSILKSTMSIVPSQDGRRQTQPTLPKRLKI